MCVLLHVLKLQVDCLEFFTIFMISNMLARCVFATEEFINSCTVNVHLPTDLIQSARVENVRWAFWILNLSCFWYHSTICLTSALQGSLITSQVEGATSFSYFPLFAQNHFLSLKEIWENYSQRLKLEPPSCKNPYESLKLNTEWH